MRAAIGRTSAVQWNGPPLVSIGLSAFYAGNDLRGVEPWISGPSPNGANIIADLARVPAGMTASSDGLVVHGVTSNYALCVLDDGVHGRELWRSSGTATSTVLLRDFSPGAASTVFSNLETFADGTYFTTDNDGGTLWRSDGTGQGTKVLANKRTHGIGANAWIFAENFSGLCRM